jgi:hypothetical protein
LRLHFIQYYKADTSTVDEMGGTFSIHMGDVEKLKEEYLLEI